MLPTSSGVGFARGVTNPRAVPQYKTKVKATGQPTMSVFVHRELQDGRQGEPAITRERRHLGKIHESHCKPWSCLAYSYLNRRIEVFADLCSSMDRRNE